MKRKILITGGAGFIGYHLSKSLLKSPINELLIVDNLQRGKMDDDLKSLLKNKRVVFLNGDLTSMDFFKQLPTDFDHVYHLAAVNGTRYFYEIPHEVLRINVVSLINILEWLKNFSKKPKFMFTSSNEAYAGALDSFDRLPIPTPEDVPLVISDVFNSRWSYGGSKLIGEIFAIHYANFHKIPTLIVRPHNFYGPRAGTEHVIPSLIIKNFKATSPFELYSPEQTRSFCYIDDAVDAMIKLMHKDDIFTDRVVDIFHIGSEEETSIKNLAKTIFKVMKKTPKKIVSKPALEGSVNRRLPKISKIKKTIDWEPKTSLYNGLKKTFDWYKTNI
jgi:nucleoside-diphosphate-sugar epimerase